MRRYNAGADIGKKKRQKAKEDRIKVEEVMIHYIKGRITETMDSGVVIERNGIGYELTVPALSAVYMAPADQEVTV